MNSSHFKSVKEKGQALVEFAFVLIFLLMIIFVIIESARILQAQLTISNAAREGARYGITGDYMTECLPICQEPRVDSIREITRDTTTGIPIDDNAVFAEPRYYLIEVFGTDDKGVLIPDYAGAPGMPLVVRTSYRIEIITPILNSIAPSLLLSAQTVLNNENFNQYGGSQENITPPDFPDIPTVGPSQTPTPSPTPIPCQTNIIEQFVLTTDTGVTISGDIGTSVILRDLNDGLNILAGPIAFAEPAIGNCTGSVVIGGLDLTSLEGHILQGLVTDDNWDTVEVFDSEPNLPTETPIPSETPTLTPSPTTTPSPTITPSPTPSLTPTPTSTSAAAFIELSPACGSSGQLTQASGGSWVNSPNNRDLTVHWDTVDGTQLGSINNMNSPTWEIAISIPSGLADGTYNVWARRSSTGQSFQVASTTFVIPCPVTPTPTPTATSTNTPTTTPSPTNTITPTPTTTQVPSDLTIGIVELVSTPDIVEYKPVDFQVVITNTGAADISNQFFVGLYVDPLPEPISTTTTISSTYLLDIVGITSLAGGSSQTVNLRLDDGFSGVGAHTVYALVDNLPPPTGLIVETETNNLSPALSVPVVAGVAPTPSPTPPVQEVGRLIGVGNVWINSNMVPQYNIQVKAIFDDGLGNTYPVGTRYTDQNGIYSFDDIPATTLQDSSYTVTGCIVLNGIEYSGSITGISIPEDDTTRVDLYLFPSPCP